MTAYLELDVSGAEINLSLTRENVLEEERRKTIQRTNTEPNNSVNVELLFPSIFGAWEPYPSMILQIQFGLSNLMTISRLPQPIYEQNQGERRQTLPTS